MHEVGLLFLHSVNNLTLGVFYKTILLHLPNSAVFHKAVFSLLELLVKTAVPASVLPVGGG